MIENSLLDRYLLCVDACYYVATDIYISIPELLRLSPTDLKLDPNEVCTVGS